MIDVAEIPEIRVRSPHRIAEALRERPRGRLPDGPGSRLLIVAADHPARGALAAGGQAMAMADRAELLRRCVTALSRPGVHGFLGTADVIEDLALLGALDGKLVYGSMNRGGLAGAAFEVDDRFTGYDARGVAEAGLDGGKMLLRLDYSDPASVRTLAAAAAAVDGLAERGLTAIVEPFVSARVDGRLRNDLTPDAVVRSVAVAAGLGRTSAYTWLKIPHVTGMDAVLAATTLPVFVLGGEAPQQLDDAVAGWGAALALPGVKGLMIGRSLLYPPDGDVAAAVDRAVGVL